MPSIQLVFELDGQGQGQGSNALIYVHVVEECVQKEGNLGDK
jgi:hypothetical protein